MFCSHSGTSQQQRLSDHCSRAASGEGRWAVLALEMAKSSPHPHLGAQHSPLPSPCLLQSRNPKSTGRGGGEGFHRGVFFWAVLSWGGTGAPLNRARGIPVHHFCHSGASQQVPRSLGGSCCGRNQGTRRRLATFVSELLPARRQPPNRCSLSARQHPSSARQGADNGLFVPSPRREEGWEQAGMGAGVWQELCCRASPPGRQQQ